MSLADTLRAATSVIATSVLPGLAKSTVTVKRPPSSSAAGARNPDGTSVTLGGYPTVLAGIQIYIEQPKGGHMMYAWGQETKAEYESQIPIGLDIRENDSVLVTAGDFAGIDMKVEQRQAIPNGNVAVLALSGTARTL